MIKSVIDWTRNVALFSAVSVMAAGAMGCGASAADGNGTDDEAIMGGSADTTHRAAVLVGMSLPNVNGLIECSGILIRSNVVLTVGHCVKGGVGWIVNSTFTGKAATSTSGALFNFNGDGFATLDVGLIFLSSAIALPVYPTIVGNAIGVGTKVEFVGRDHNNSTAANSLWTSAVLPVTQENATSYITAQTAQPGDSGGPVFEAGTTKLVGITWAQSPAQSPTQSLFTRSDKFKAWVTSMLASHK